MRIQYDKVIRQAGQIDTLGAEMNRIANELDAMMNEIPGFWRGEAATAYLKACMELIRNIRSTSHDISSVSRQIKSVANRIHDEDERIAREILMKGRIT